MLSRFLWRFQLWLKESCRTADRTTTGGEIGTCAETSPGTCQGEHPDRIVIRAVVKCHTELLQQGRTERVSRLGRSG